MTKAKHQEAVGNAIKPKPTLVYVAGLAYSGTTLFASALNHSNNIVNGGEINYAENDYHHEKQCSCGQKIDNCSFWKPVLADLEKDAANGEKVLNFSPAQDLRPIDSRQRSIWKKILLVVGVPAEKIFGTPEIKDYVDRHSNFVETLAKAAHSDFVVDASKSFARLDVLNRYSNLQIRVIFLKRSPIQSYASRLKRAKRRNRFYLQVLAPIYLAIQIASTLAMHRQMRRISSQNMTYVDYEKFVQHPELVQSELAEVLGTDVDFGVDNKMLPIDHLHIFTGNIWLSKALKNGPTVELRPGDGTSSLSGFEKLVFSLFSPLSSRIGKT